MKKVLIVDDATIMRHLVKKIVEELGYQVAGEAGDPQEAIDKYKKLRPDIVTMDITMPQVNGIEDGIAATKKILKLDMDAKIIMVTSHGEKDKVIHALKAGAMGYILKPIKKEGLEEAFLKALG